MASDELRENVAHHMAFVHESVEARTGAYRQQERRNVYTTPKSYLELIQLYKKLLTTNSGEVLAMKTRLETGLIKLRSSAAQVADMQVQLKDEAVVVELKIIVCIRLFVVVFDRRIETRNRRVKL